VVKNAKVPPHNLEAEQSVLGAILMDESNIARAEELLSPHDFYRGAHKEIYEAMLDLHNERKPIDTVTLINSLRNRGVLEKLAALVILVSLLRWCQLIETIWNTARSFMKRR
jgi:Replicative DNA helicase